MERKEQKLTNYIVMNNLMRDDITSFLDDWYFVVHEDFLVF